MSLWINEDALAEDPARLKSSVTVGPPLVAVAPIRTSVIYLPGRSLTQPVGGEDGFSPDSAAIQHELPEARVVPKARRQTTSAHLGT